eukprot:86507-Prymnesium_polylepis.2
MRRDPWRVVGTPAALTARRARRRRGGRAARRPARGRASTAPARAAYGWGRRQSASARHASPRPR